MTLFSAVLKAFEEQPKVFSGITVIERVRELTGRGKVYDGSILRVLRELRKKGIINYHCVGDRKLSQYEKI